MLSMYSIIKPPKMGNCSILEGSKCFTSEKKKSLIYIPSNLFLFIENVPVITISDLKSIINDPNGTNERLEKVKKLEKKIDDIVEEGYWTLDDIFKEHSYSNLDSTVFECIVYFLAG